LANNKHHNIFEPIESPLANFEPAESEYQFNINPSSEAVEDLALPDEKGEAGERSFRLLYAAFILVVIILAVRLINLQVTNGQVFQVLAKGNSIEARILPPPRGQIIDANGITLTKNNPIYTLNLYPAQLPKDKGDREVIYKKIEETTGIKTTDIIAEVDKHGLRSLAPINLKSNLDRDTALLWRTNLGFILGLSVDEEPVRSYNSEAGLGHLLGYVGKVTDQELKNRPDLSLTAQIGKTGLEESYDHQLQGREGKEQLEVDSKGQIQRVVSAQPALPGQSLKLYLNLELQKVMATALEKGIKAAGRTKGVAIAMDPNNGGILSMVSLPAYDNNLFVDATKQGERQALFSNQDQPLFDRAVAGTYPPGSTSKPIWAIAGLQEGIISENTDIKTPSEITIGQSVFPDWKAHDHADVRKAIAESNNIFFYALAGGYDKIKGLGPQRMKDWATKFGWGQATNIDLPGERKGLVPDPDWKQKTIKEPWYIGDTYHHGIGQGYLAITPIQLIRSIAAIANGGTLYEPRLVSEVRDLDGNVTETPGNKVVSKNIADANTFRIVREGMRQTVLGGTARPLNEIKMPIAGKTGTAQFEDQEKTHAWFVGFAPYDKPTITLLVMVEGGGESFTVAVPIAKEILAWYSEHVYATPSP
jgi:penicillin-binding protein 2